MEWISVEDKEPPRFKQLIMWSREGTIADYHLIVAWEDWHEAVDLDEITHWMIIEEPKE